ncbi:short-chain fatty acyl-CoA regulator family protein [Thetidibacter halocola]|uniref:DUF2083 domain-containing protein n=1 Tax=Thetidibacter halocola TaxID=2827239 RepID=A0A8J7WKL8_9RHOB|nr:short-chain fatty acyl-CoA regulator family protein [Thetidibacter halocola]MBS0126744.1 DUF2083 domain-containing protein [Thetidibacter halocola]
MAQDTLTGSRIRERRVARRMKQADLARQAGISASYLNLIEHNRRRIGGKLLVDIAEILGVEPSALTEGAGAAMIATLREAAIAVPQAAAELDRVDEFAGRFPGWAQLLADGRTRIAALERMVETLNDRLTHDPHLAASLHEMLSTVTAIRSTATILTEPGEVEPEWQKRFLRNIFEDSGRLAETSRALVTFLEADGETVTETGTPQEEMDNALEAEGHHVPDLEQGGSVAQALDRIGQGLSTAGRSLLRQFLNRYAADAAALPADRLADAVTRLGPDPAALAQALGTDPALVMRRLAALPEDLLPEPVGLVICDPSGVLSYRKPLPEFALPRIGAACPLWPLYRALNRPMVIIAQAIAQAGRPGEGVRAEALAVPRGPIAVNADPQYDAHMLLRALPRDQRPQEVQPVGVTCRICPRKACPVRREPSVVAGID